MARTDSGAILVKGGRGARRFQFGRPAAYNFVILEKNSARPVVVAGGGWRVAFFPAPIVATGRISISARRRSLNSLPGFQGRDAKRARARLGPNSGAAGQQWRC